MVSVTLKSCQSVDVANHSGEKIEGEYRRQQIEDFFIHTLDTLTPKGLNGTISLNARVLPLKIMFTEDIHQWGKATTRYWYCHIYPLFYRVLPRCALIAVKHKKTSRIFFANPDWTNHTPLTRLQEHQMKPTDRRRKHHRKMFELF